MRICKTLTEFRRKARALPHPHALLTQASCMAFNAAVGKRKTVGWYEALIGEAVWGAYSRGFKDGEAKRRRK